MGDAAMAVVPAEEELPRSEYELQTQGNIAQNKRKLQQLGFRQACHPDEGGAEAEAEGEDTERSSGRQYDGHTSRSHSGCG